MDQTHQEFVDLVERIYQSEGEAELAALDELIARTEAHFEMEERWMDLTGFARDNCHSKQHNMVLTLMRARWPGAPAKAKQSFVKRLAEELTTWLPGARRHDGRRAGLPLPAGHLRLRHRDLHRPGSSSPAPAHEASSGLRQRQLRLSPHPAGERAPPPVRGHARMSPRHPAPKAVKMPPLPPHRDVPCPGHHEVGWLPGFARFQTRFRAIVDGLAYQTLDPVVDPPVCSAPAWLACHPRGAPPPGQDSVLGHQASRSSALPGSCLARPLTPRRWQARGSRCRPGAHGDRCQRAGPRPCLVLLESSGIHAADAMLMASLKACRFALPAASPWHAARHVMSHSWDARAPRTGPLFPAGLPQGRAHGRATGSIRLVFSASKTARGVHRSHLGPGQPRSRCKPAWTPPEGACATMA